MEVADSLRKAGSVLQSCTLKSVADLRESRCDVSSMVSGFRRPEMHAMMSLTSEEGTSVSRRSGVLRAETNRGEKVGTNVALPFGVSLAMLVLPSKEFCFLGSVSCGALPTFRAGNPLYRL